MSELCKIGVCTAAEEARQVEPYLFFILLSLLLIFPLPVHSCTGQRVCEFRAFCCLFFFGALLPSFQHNPGSLFALLLLLCLLLAASVSSWPCFIQTWKSWCCLVVFPSKDLVRSVVVEAAARSCAVHFPSLYRDFCSVPARRGRDPPVKPASWLPSLAGVFPSCFLSGGFGG